MSCLRIDFKFEAAPDRKVTTGPLISVLSRSDGCLKRKLWEAILGPERIKPAGTLPLPLCTLALVLVQREISNVLSRRRVLNKGGNFFQGVLIWIAQYRLQFCSVWLLSSSGGTFCFYLYLTLRSCPMTVIKLLAQGDASIILQSTQEPLKSESSRMFLCVWMGVAAYPPSLCRSFRRVLNCRKRKYKSRLENKLGLL